MMLLEVFHVPQGVHANARTDDTDDERHDNGEFVDAHLGGELMAGQDGYFQPNRHHKLHQSQSERQHAFVADRVGKNEDTDGYFDQEIDDSQNAGRRFGKREIRRALTEIANREYD